MSEAQLENARQLLVRWQLILLPLVRAAADHDDPVSWQLAEILCGNESVLFVNASTLAVLRAALASAVRAGDPRAQAVLGLQLAQTLRYLGEIAAAERAADDVVAAAPDDAAVLAHAYSEVGGSCWSRGDMTGALRNVDKAIVFARAADDMTELTRVRINRGTALRDLGRIDEALAAYDEAIATNTPELSWDIVRAAALAARSCTDVGDEPRAIAYLRWARTKPGPPPTVLVQVTLIVFSRLHAARGNTRRAMSRSGAAMAHSARLSDRHWHLGAVVEHADRLRDAGQPADAIAVVGPVVAEAAGGGLDSIEARARIVLAQSALATGRVDTAVTEAQTILAVGGDTGVWVAGDALVVLARAALAGGEYEVALHRARAAVAANEPYRFVRPTTRSLVALRDVAGSMPAARDERDHAQARLLALGRTTRLNPADLDAR